MSVPMLGALIAMKGKDCVALATDTRFSMGQVTLDTTFPKTFRVNKDTFVGMCGLPTDIQTVREKLRFHVNSYKLTEDRDIKSSTLQHLIAHLLYEKRFQPYFIEPLIVGLEDGKPYIGSMDLIGAEIATDVVGGMSEALLGICESLFKENMDEDQLFETISQALLSGGARDANAGWGGVVHIITKDGVTTKTLKSRMD